MAATGIFGYGYSSSSDDEAETKSYYDFKAPWVFKLPDTTMMEYNKNFANNWAMANSVNGLIDPVTGLREKRLFGRNNKPSTKSATASTTTPPTSRGLHCICEDLIMTRASTLRAHRLEGAGSLSQNKNIVNTTTTTAKNHSKKRKKRTNISDRSSTGETEEVEIQPKGSFSRPKKPRTKTINKPTLETDATTKTSHANRIGAVSTTNPHLISPSNPTQTQGDTANFPTPRLHGSGSNLHNQTQLHSSQMQQQALLPPPPSTSHLTGQPPYLSTGAGGTKIITTIKTTTTPEGLTTTTTTTTTTTIVGPPTPNQLALGDGSHQTNHTSVAPHNLGVNLAQIQHPSQQIEYNKFSSADPFHPGSSHSSSQHIPTPPVGLYSPSPTPSLSQSNTVTRTQSQYQRQQQPLSPPTESQGEPNFFFDNKKLDSQPPKKRKIFNCPFAGCDAVYKGPSGLHYHTTMKHPRTAPRK